MVLPFEKLPEEKQLPIRQAVLAEFASHGRKRASTNRIVAEAGISKGTLFNYFGSKAELWNYAVSYTLKRMSQQVEEMVLSHSDVISRFEKAAEMKLQLYIQEPSFFEFAGNLLVVYANELSTQQKEEMYRLQAEMKERMFSGVDYSMLRQDLPAERIIHMLHYAIEGYSDSVLKRLEGHRITQEELDPLWDEFRQYLKDLRIVYYSGGAGEEAH
ncbi:TetR/AcrR family transcriptional regulator [Alkalicoccus urumqiensis]|uniref:HTH tetR-type domain-containing protein n=1 Tax=Alkalicoccus urumqiensis TaxID=1548213 RepID=A0A2P6MJB7_ALKUR|nr:TetR/AcrR family transcriptional regulator [Alkalicoccus urumqiensis]PRO66372.1 hypothetical protein C6I21_06105 [Alkalicoccus urumqiensis]